MVLLFNNSIGSISRVNGGKLILNTLAHRNIEVKEEQINDIIRELRSLNNVAIYDNIGKSYDRITVVFLNEKQHKENNKIVYNAVGSDIDGSGFFQNIQCIRGKHLGQKVNNFSKLDLSLQRKIIFNQLMELVPNFTIV